MNKTIPTKKENILRIAIKNSIFYCNWIQCKWTAAPGYKSLTVLASVSEVAEHDVVFDHKKPVALWDAVHREENWEHWFLVEEQGVCVCDLACVCLCVHELSGT